MNITDILKNILLPNEINQSFIDTKVKKVVIKKQRTKNKRENQQILSNILSQDLCEKILYEINKLHKKKHVIKVSIKNKKIPLTIFSTKK